jgi:hydrogenase maturation protein HypF
MQTITDKSTRLHLTIFGIVQGVGFRPFIYNLALTHKLVGFVRNNGGWVEVEIEGYPENIRQFVEKLKNSAPPLASIMQIDSKYVALKAEEKFEIISSCEDSAKKVFISPDIATCEECLAELLNPKDRRYRYPFINCTNCGPRFTIIKSLPYDRHTTTMLPFTMCVACQKEYDNPGSRRFHAQANACAECGPSIVFSSANHNLSGESAIKFALAELRDGKVLAIKGLGGFHLVCDANNPDAIRKLRQRKKRICKPFALMFANISMVFSHCKVSSGEKAELLSPSSPIVLLDKLPESSLPEEINPGTNRLGVMLPYTPLHYLITHDYGYPLIFTSANLSDEPISIDNDEAKLRLADIADGFLEHNRVIYSRYEDSVVQFFTSKRMFIRRSRGYAPAPIKLPFNSTYTILASGGHLKNTFCFIRDNQAFVSQHIGDLGSLEAEEHFLHTIKTYKTLFDLQPDVIACDLHPDYVSTTIAPSLGNSQIPIIAVQHHHAHIASCMVENNLTKQVIGVAFDGLGYGDDGTLWGGEFFLADLKTYKRKAYFEPFPMPGGALTIKEPWRMALSYVLSSPQSSRNCFDGFVQTIIERYGVLAFEITKKQIDNKLNSPLTSSCGRLFDAMSALLDICQKSNYEGQAAIELEAIASQAKEIKCSRDYIYDYEVINNEISYVVQPSQIFLLAYRDLIQGLPLTEIAVKFHCTIAYIILDICSILRNKTGLNTVCFSGGVFQNRLLYSLVNKLLTEAEFEIYFPVNLPANDGGLSLGQAVVALANVQSGENKCV